MDFIKKSAWSFAAVVARGVGALAINKIFAVYFGTAGITFLAHFQNLISIFTQIPSDGINRGVIQSWASTTLKREQKQEILSSGILLTAVSFTLIMIGVFIYRDIFINPFIQFIQGGIFLILVIFSILAILANALVQSLIIANKKVRDYAWISIISMGLLLAALAWSVGYRLLEVAFIAYALGNAISLIVSILFYYRSKPPQVTLSEPTLKSMKHLGHFILMALAVLVFGKLLDFMVRTFSISWFGVEETGYWQSLVKLSDAYVMAFIGTVGVVYFPEISSRLEDRKSLFQYINQVLIIVVPVVFVGLVVIYMLGEPILGLLFSESFKPAYAYMYWQLGGDAFMLISYLFAYVLMARKKTAWYIFLQFISAFTYIAVILIFKDQKGVESILMGHLARNIVFFAILLLLIRKK